MDAHANFAYSTVATAPSPAASGTTLTVQTGDGAKFPAVPFNATVWPTATIPTTTNAEIVRVTAISTDTLTISRTQESSSARTIIASDAIAATITKKMVTDIETDIASADTQIALQAAQIAARTQADQGYYVATGGALAVSGTAGKLDLAAGIDIFSTSQVTYAAQTAISTTITTLASGLTSGQSLWVAVELDSSSVVQFNSGSAAVTPTFPTPTASRVVHGWLWVPFGATTVDTTYGSGATVAKLFEARQIRNPMGLASKTIADTAYTAGTTDTFIYGRYAYTSLTASRIFTLCAANAVVPGTLLIVEDDSGSPTLAIQIQIKPAGSDTVAGVAAATNFEIICEPLGVLTLRSDGVSNWEIVSVLPATRRELWTASGTTRKPLTATSARIFAMGGGGAGGAGEKQAINNAAGGGGGGGCGAISEGLFVAADFSATETVTVGAAGAAGGTRTSTGAGAAGGAGGDSKVTMGGTNPIIWAGGGGGGGGGTAGAGGAVGAVSTSGIVPVYVSNGAGGLGGDGNVSSAATAGSQGAYGSGGGGGGGGGVSAAMAAQAAAAGGRSSAGLRVLGTGGAGGAAGASGTSPAVGSAGSAFTAAGANQVYGGTGGGGGGAKTNAGAGVAGGAAGLYGGGGGGGGNGVGATGTNANGNGGAGAAGVVLIIWHR